jgi:dTMP kinase
MAKGRYIVLEGPKGVGKTTQALLLESTLKSARLPVKLISEDDNQDDASLLAIEALASNPNQQLNNHTRLLLHNAARSRSLELIHAQVDSGTICIADQNFLTTLTMQYYGLHSIDNYDSLSQIINFSNNYIEPDITIVLDAEVTTLIERIKATATEDIIKLYDESLLERLRAGYLWEAKEHGYRIIYAIGSKAEVFNNIWAVITENITHGDKSQSLIESSEHINSVGEILVKKATSSRKVSTNKTPQLNLNPKVSNVEVNGIEKAEPESLKAEDTLLHIITNANSNVYGFTPVLNPETVGHIVSYASSKNLNIRQTLLKEFCAADKESRRRLLKLARELDDRRTLLSTKRYFVIERASELAISYLNQSGIKNDIIVNISGEFNSKDYKFQKNSYYMPTELDEKNNKLFSQNLEQIINLRNKIVDQLVNYLNKTISSKSKKTSNNLNQLRTTAFIATKPLIPVATCISTVLQASAKEYKQLAQKLLRENINEYKLIAKDIIHELGKLLEENDSGAKGLGTSSDKQNNLNLANRYLTNNYVESDDSLYLVRFWPRNEIEIISNILYKQATASVLTLNKAVESLPYDKKLEVFNSTIKKPVTKERIIESEFNKFNYEFDAIGDFGIFCELQRSQVFESIERQKLTLRNGFAIPEIIEAAGETDDFEEAFSISLKLFSSLQKYNYSIAQYATLFGHKHRARLMINGPDIYRIYQYILKPEIYPGTHRLLSQIIEKISQVHPLFSELIQTIDT